MNLAVIVFDVLLMLAATVVLMLLLGALSRRLLGVRMSAGRIILAGVLGLAAGVGFESQFIWRAADYTPAMIPVLFGIIILVTVTVLVVSELLIPQGTLPRPDQWARLTRATFDRNNRYLELLRIAARHRLFTIKLGPGSNAAQAPSSKRAGPCAEASTRGSRRGVREARATTLHPTRRPPGRVPRSPHHASATRSARNLGRDPS
ncbi:hypothetical protein JM654_00300 [Microbacterium oxydans]|nr:hypothetical protein [Microbacterium oxydans]